MTIRKAVIPAAGIGSRFLPITKTVPKEMLPIVDTPAIQFIVEEAISSGIERVLIVTNSSKRMIEDYFDKSTELEMNLEKQGKAALRDMVRDISSMVDIHFIRQKEPLGLGHALLMARQFVDGEPFAVLLPDDLIHSTRPCLQEMIEVHEQFDTSILAVQRVPRHELERYGVIAPASGATLLGRRTQWVHDLVEKPRCADAPSDRAIVGRYILEPEIFDVLQCLPPGHAGEIQLTDALRQLNRRHSMIAWEIAGKRYDIGEKLGYIRASLDYALTRPELRDEVFSYVDSLRTASVIPEFETRTLI